MLFIVVLSISGWEIYLRTHGVPISYDDGKELWANKRADVYMPSDKATVFIGSSRNKYDLDVKTWNDLTGESVVQLAIEGTNPLPIFDDLANDKKFKGKLMVDVTEGLFFSTSPGNISDPKEKIAYYKKRTPSERFSFEVNHLLETQLVFLDKGHYSLNALLDLTRIPSRPGVFVEPIFPMEFDRVRFSRQDYMTPKFLTDTNLQNQVKGIWNFFRSMSKEKPTDGAKLDSILATVKADVDKIQARGGNVIFVRTPSSGPFLMGERMGFPREKYWERILSITGCKGIHFEDYPAVANFQCPEFSHLAPADAITWTTNLVDILQKEKGWTFPNKPAGK
jgi:hypothetical protein